MNERSLLSPAVSFFKDLPEILNTPITLPKLSSYSRNQVKLKDKSDSSVERFIIEGRVNLGNNSVFAIDNEEFVFDENTLIVGELEIGALIRLKGMFMDCQRYAISITVICPPK